MCIEGKLKGESWSLSNITWGFILSTPLYNLPNPTFLTVINSIFISATYAPINVIPAGGRGRAWHGDLIVFVGSGVGYLTDLALPGEVVFECFFTHGALMNILKYSGTLLIWSLTGHKNLAILQGLAQISWLKGRNDKYTIYRIQHTVLINKQPKCRYHVQYWKNYFKFSFSTPCPASPSFTLIGALQ